MALTQIWNCDRCGDRISPDDRSSLKPVVGPRRHDDQLDLCGQCNEALGLWLGDPAGRKDEDQTPSRGRRPAAATVPPTATSGAPAKV
jgi:hypothetical protein